jgi:hypothetical protein
MILSVKAGVLYGISAGFVMMVVGIQMNFLRVWRLSYGKVYNFSKLFMQLKC